MKAVAARAGGGTSDGYAIIACWQERGCRSSSRALVAPRNIQTRMHVEKAAVENASPASPLFPGDGPPDVPGTAISPLLLRALLPGQTDFSPKHITDFGSAQGQQEA